LLSLKCSSFYGFSEEEQEEECEQLTLSESVIRLSSGNTSSELASGYTYNTFVGYQVKHAPDLGPMLRLQKYFRKKCGENIGVFCSNFC
jgi:hypothetical protein